MNRMNRVLVAGLAAFLTMNGVAMAQSLGDLARQERERKSGGAEPKVITTDMVAGRSGDSSATAPKSDKAGGQGDSKPADQATATDKKDDKEPAKQERDETWWRKAFAEARENVNRADSLVRALEIQLADANKALLIRDDVF